MASGGHVESEISCSVCFEIYDKPHILKECLHTFCHTCIKTLEKRGQVQCPECRVFTSSNNIKNDFKLQAIIDAYSKERDDEIVQSINSLGASICEMCKKSKQMKSKCTDCEQYMCEDCEVTHKGIKSCKNHKVISVMVVIENITGDLKRFLSDLQKDKQTVEKDMSKARLQREGIKVKKEQKLEEIAKYTNDCIEDLQQNRKLLEESIIKCSENYNDMLGDSIALFEKGRSEIAKKIDFINETLKSQDIAVLSETKATLDATLKKEIENIKGFLPVLNTRITLPVTVEKSAEWDPNVALRIKVDSDDDIVEVLLSAYYELLRKSISHEKCVPLDNPQNIRLIDNELWVSTWNKGIDVYNKELQKVKCIKNSEVRCVVDVTKDHKGNILVSCASGNGYHQLNFNCYYQTEIAKGSFAGLCIYKKYVYVLEYNNCEILVLENQNNKWAEEKRIKLNYKHRDSFDRIHVGSEGVYVSSFSGHCVYRYTLQGELQQQYGSAQIFDRPLMCDVDHMGNLLVADCGHHQLKVFNKNWQCKVVPLPGNIGDILKVVVDHKSMMLWLVQQKPGQIVRYSFAWNKS